MDIERFVIGPEAFNWDLYDYLLIAPAHEVQSCRDCTEKRFALVDRVVLERAKTILTKVQFRSVALKLDQESYQYNKEWLDPLLAALGTPVDDLPFETLTCYLDVKVSHE